MECTPTRGSTPAHFTSELALADFDYALPPGLIAQHPLPERSASRLLHVQADRLDDLRFADLERLLAPGEVLVFNDTRVIKARLFGRKPSGGKVELLVERILAPRRALALVRTSHSPKPGTVFEFGEPVAARATVCGRRDDFFALEFDADLLPLLEAHGHVPLPPYIAHADAPEDSARYQTVYARAPGAVAAPTAGLHFSEPLLQRLRARGVQFAHVTLHVGAGTFQPVRVERVAEHVMHREWYAIGADGRRDDQPREGRGPAHRRGRHDEPARARVGSAATPAGWRVGAGSADTRLFIMPGYGFRIVDRLITNFHLPKSTLLMLVSAFAGLRRIRAAYAHAIAQGYRFFSYGDALLLERCPHDMQ